MTAFRKTETANSIDESDVDAFVSRIGWRVRKARHEARISRRELSERSGVSQRYLAQLESGGGNISAGLLYKVALALKMTPGALMRERQEDAEEVAALFSSASADLQQRVLALLRQEGEAKSRARRVCLIGLRGAGKSTLGRKLAADLSMPFVELNHLIEQQSGMPVGELIALYGQEGYRKLEQRALQDVVEEYETVILAVGGGVVADAGTFDTLLTRFHTVWLKALPEEHMQRVRDQGDVRPMAGNPAAMSELKSLLTSRERDYARADVTVDTAGRDVEDSLNDVKRALDGLNLT